MKEKLETIKKQAKERIEELRKQTDYRFTSFKWIKS